MVIYTRITFTSECIGKLGESFQNRPLNDLVFFSLIF